MSDTPEMHETVSAEQQSEPKKKTTLLQDLLDIIESAITSVFLVLLLFAFLLRPVTVEGSSMNPTLYNQDKLLMVSLFYTPKAGDVVIINGDHANLFTDASQTTVTESKGMEIRLVKRVIAVSGQELDIDFETGTVKVDGEVRNEPYIADLTTRNDGAFAYPLTIPEGYVFVMGDNRLHSTDSRNSAVGLVSEEQVMGRAVLRFSRDDALCTTWFDQFAILN